MTRHAAFSEGPHQVISPHLDEEKNQTQHQENGYDGASIVPTGTRGTEHSEKSSGTGAHSEIGLIHKKETSKATRKLLAKMDVCILPFAVLLYLSAYLDRGNLANARLQGLQETVLDGSDTNYSIALSCFFITYIVCSIPGTLLAKQINPSRSIAFGALTWSIAATCQAAAFNRAGLFVCRLFVGVGESMFGQAMAFHRTLRIEHRQR